MKREAARARNQRHKQKVHQIQLNKFKQDLDREHKVTRHRADTGAAARCVCNELLAYHPHPRIALCVDVHEPKVVRVGSLLIASVRRGRIAKQITTSSCSRSSLCLLSRSGFGLGLAIVEASVEIFRSE